VDTRAKTAPSRKIARMSEAILRPKHVADRTQPICKMGKEEESAFGKVEA